MPPVVAPYASLEWRWKNHDSVRPAPPDDARSLRGARRFVGALGFWAFSVLNRLFPVRIVYFKYPERIGNFSMDTGMAFARRSSQRGVTLYCVQQGFPIANNFLYELVARNFRLRNWLWPVLRYANTRATIPQWIVPPHIPEGSRDTEGLLESSAGAMLFTSGEHEAGLSWLRSVGWRDGEPFVCLLVRDSAYLDSALVGKASEGFSRHDYRDSDIATYAPAAEWLAVQGVWVLRMGKTMAKPMPSSHPRIVDYAFREDRSDFLDVWLFANCNLCISTGTGPDMIADVHRRPLLTVNLLPAIALWSWSNAVTAPKPLVWRDCGRRLSVEELIAVTWLRGEQYAEQGIEIRDLDASTLLGTVQEAWGRLTGDWIDAIDDARRNQAAWAALEAHPEYANWHGYRHPEARFSSVWLRQLEDELTEHDRPKNA